MNRLLSVCLILSGPLSLCAQDLPAKAKLVFESHCYRCHGANNSKDGGMDYVLDATKLRAKKVSAGKPEESKLFQRLTDATDPMPPTEEAKRPSAEEIATVKAWIAEGAKDFPTPAAEVERKFLTVANTFERIHDYLEKLPAHKRPRQRFLSLTNLSNSKKVREAELRSSRAAVSKLLNSLSWMPIHVPELIDAEQTIFVIDLEAYGWTDAGFWSPLIEKYPYGLKHNFTPVDAKLKKHAEAIYEWTGTELPLVRADWFIFNASRPPVYHTLVGIPATVAELETRLLVDREANIRDQKVARAGFAKSGVSANNRMIERHTARHGAYWVSYDFKESSASRNLVRFPLGPAFAKNSFNAQAFDYDGGEIIFNLPNGLQAYMVVDAAGKRLDLPPPIEIVRDAKQISGSPAVVNGVSCMSCHAQGMLTDFKDEIRADSPLKGDARGHLEALYIEDTAMRKVLANDQERFVTGLGTATLSFWQTDEKPVRDIRTMPEPIGPIAKWYTSTELDLADVAVELGLPDSKELETALTQNVGGAFGRLGLLPLLRVGGSIKRDAWESLQEVTSRFQETAKLLKQGTPKFVSTPTGEKK